MMAVVAFSAVLEVVVRSSRESQPVAQMGDAGGFGVPGTSAGSSTGGQSGSSAAGSSFGGPIGGDTGDAGTVGTFGGSSVGGGSSQPAVSSGGSSPEASSASSASLSSALRTSSHSPSPSSSSATAFCGDHGVSAGEFCDPCSPPGRTETDPNCNALCTMSRCGDGFVDRRRGEECDYIGLFVEAGHSPVVSRDEEMFPRCDSDAACRGGYCFYGRCWPVQWVSYWLWQDIAICPQRWETQGTWGALISVHGALCNDLEDVRCSEFPGDGCTTDCKLERCGDGIIQSGIWTTDSLHYGLREECDDGNTTNGDGCSDRCAIEGATSSQNSLAIASTVPSSGFCEQFPHLCSSSSAAVVAVASSVSSLPFESAPPQSSAAVLSVLPSLCGDGRFDAGEECDDGIGNSDTLPDACRTDCRMPLCGDFVADYRRGEQCDQGVGNSDTAPDRCRSTCTLPRCGDGVVDRDEMCDPPSDGLFSPSGFSALCDAQCRWDLTGPTCGDGRIYTGEACDDGNVLSGDGCSSSCQFEVVLGMQQNLLNPVLIAAGALCGDGIVAPSEECDDGNAVSGDGCSLSCSIETPLCGNGRVESGEQCDPPGDDGCNQLCQIVFLPKPAPPVPQSLPYAQVIPSQPLPYVLIPLARAPVGDTGPAAVAVLASGAAAGYAWMRRKKKRKNDQE
jgi:cysteine-rich repeat protein